MSNDLTVQPGSAADVLALLKQQQENKYATPSVAADMTKIGDWLPFVAVMGSNNPLVQSGGFPMGHFAFYEGKVPFDMGTELVAMILGWRAKAVQYKPDFISYYNPESPQFKQIEIDSMQPRSNKGYGPEFFLWLPEVKDGKFATIHFGNPTGRFEAPNLIAAYNEGRLACKLKCELIDYKKQKTKYHGARYYPYDLAINRMPPGDKLVLEKNKFSNPPETTSQPAEKAEPSGDDRG